MLKRSQIQPAINNSILTLDKGIDIHLHNDFPKTAVLKYFLNAGFDTGKFMRFRKTKVHKNNNLKCN